MGDKSIKSSEKKKKKKVETASSAAPSAMLRSVEVQPELIKKKKKIK